ncbi:hypothetical protein [Ferrovum sp.]|uniref:hypothetical protein n=1 Tax=Ferrovum sp. TaxID=2609467 RepID=UPI002614810A|nr:hypothetical protein [Ferrovum sp.]
MSQKSVPACPRCKTNQYVIPDHQWEVAGKKTGFVCGGIAGAIAGGTGMVDGAAIGSVIPGAGTLIGGATGALLCGVLGFFTGGFMVSKASQYAGQCFDHGYRCTACRWHS